MGTDAFLEIAVAREPMLTDLINTALDANNVVAIDALTGHDPNPDLQYNYGRSGSDAAWQLVKWQLDNARKVNEINAIDETLSYFSVDKLKYGFEKGVDPKNFPGFLHKIIRSYEIRPPKTPLSRDETDALINKLTLLLDQGADIHGKDEFGYEAISVVFTFNAPMEPVLRVLIDRGAHVNTQAPHYPCTLEPATWNPELPIFNPINYQIWQNWRGNVWYPNRSTVNLRGSGDS